MTEPIRISDLTGKQVQAVERKVGLPAHRWSDVQSDADLIAAVASEVLGGSVEQYLDMPWKELAALVIAEDDEDDAGND